MSNGSHATVEFLVGHVEVFRLAADPVILYHFVRDFSGRLHPIQDSTTSSRSSQLSGRGSSSYRSEETSRGSVGFLSSASSGVGRSFTANVTLRLDSRSARMSFAT